MACRFWCCCIPFVLLLSGGLYQVEATRILDVVDEFIHKQNHKHSDSPWFCHDLDCPDYKVTNKTDHYEVREYASAKYVSTTIHSFVYGEAVMKGFKRLFDYISGANEDQVKIAMTAPVTVKVEPGAGPFCESNFTVSFFVPHDYQNNTPVPTHEDVFIRELPTTMVYVLQFGGFAGDLTVTMKARELAHLLEQRDAEFESGFYYAVAYDPPFRLLGRHNEVWILAAANSASDSSARALASEDARAHEVLVLP